MKIDKMHVEIGSGEGCGDNAKADGLRGLTIPRFLLNIFDMVEDPKTNSLISWSSNRESFVISDHIQFTAELLPKYFRHNNLSSFIYQLNNYGFRKVNHERHEYENQWFRPGKKHWLKSIKSRVQKSKMGQRYGSFIDLEKGDLDAMMKKLRGEQINLRAEIQKLKEQQENMEKEFARVKGMENSYNGDEERIVSSFSMEVIEMVKEKMGRTEVTEKRKMGGDNEGGNSSSGSGNKKRKGEEEVVIEPELQSRDEAKKEENFASWKKYLFEDDSYAENGVEEMHPFQDSKIMVEFDDMMASKIARESLISKVAGFEGEDDDVHLQLWT